jgi:hypothetical protein
MRLNNDVKYLIQYISDTKTFCIFTPAINLLRTAS